MRASPIKLKFLKRNRHGAAIVEMAICLTVLTVFTFAIAQYSIIYSTMNSLSMISREAARYAAVHHSDPNFFANSSTTGSLQSYIATVANGNSVVSGSDLTYQTAWFTCTDPTNSATSSTAPSTTACGSGNFMQITFQYDMSKKIFAAGLVPGLPTGSMKVTRTSTVLME